jgi:hypothetical protein
VSVEVTIGPWRRQLAHALIKLGTWRRKQLSPEDPLWLNVLEGMGQPMCLKKPQ